MPRTALRVNNPRPANATRRTYKVTNEALKAAIRMSRNPAARMALRAFRFTPVGRVVDLFLIMETLLRPDGQNYSTSPGYTQFLNCSTGPMKFEFNGTNSCLTPIRVLNAAFEALPNWSQLQADPLFGTVPYASFRGDPDGARTWRVHVASFQPNAVPQPGLAWLPNPINPQTNPNLDRAIKTAIARAPKGKQENPLFRQLRDLNPSEVEQRLSSPTFLTKFADAPGKSTVRIAQPGRSVRFRPGVTARPTPRGSKEAKVLTTTAKIGIAIYRALDKISEGAEIVDAAFEALPKRVQDAWKKKHAASRRQVDTFGQYGIDGADWKLQALYYNFHKVNWEAFALNVLQNEFEDQIIGRKAAIEGSMGNKNGNRMLDAEFGKFVSKVTGAARQRIDTLIQGMKG